MPQSSSRSCCARLLDALGCCCFRNSRGNVARYMGQSSSREGVNHDISLNMILHGECGVGKTSLRNRWVDGAFTGDVAPTYGVDFNIKTLDLVHEVEGDDEEEEEEEKEEKIQENERGGMAEGEEVEWVGQKTGSASQRGEGRGERAALTPRAELQVKINVYDTSGKAGYREVNSTYLLAFDAVLFVYDVSAMSSLTELRRYFSDPAHRDKLAAKKKAGAAMLLVGNKSDVPLSQRQVGSQTGEDTAAEFGLPFLEVSAKSGSNVKEAFMSIATRAVGEHLVRNQFRKRKTRMAVTRTVESLPGLQVTPK